MGASGGLSWIKIKELSKADRVSELICPIFWLCQKWHDEDYDYLDKIPLNCLVSRNGDFLGDDYDILQDLANILKDPIPEEQDLTFEELTLDLATRPTWQYGSLDESNYGLSYLQIRMIKALKWRGPLELNLEHLGAIRHLLIQDWIKELRSYLDYKNVNSIETWT